MSQTTDDLKQELKKSRTLVRTLLGEVRVKLHLGGMEARDAFAKLEKDAERITHETTQASRQALQELSERLRKLSRSLTEKQPPATPPVS